MSYKLMRNILEWLVGITSVVGVITAALNFTFGGFTPVVWFLIALLAVVLIICTEVTQTREFLEKNK